MNNIRPFFCVAYCSKNVCWRSRHFSTSTEVPTRHVGTGAELSGHFGPVRWCQNVLGPKCAGSEVSYCCMLSTVWKNYLRSTS